MRKAETEEVPYVPEGSTWVQEEVFIEEESVPDRKTKQKNKYVMRILQMVLYVV